MKTTNNPYTLLADIGDSIKWMQNILALMKAAEKAKGQYLHTKLPKHLEKFKQLDKLVREYPEYEAIQWQE